jgi:hypothetical protein
MRGVQELKFNGLAGLFERSANQETQTRLRSGYLSRTAAVPPTLGAQNRDGLTDHGRRMTARLRSRECPPRLPSPLISGDWDVRRPTICWSRLAGLHRRRARRWLNGGEALRAALGPDGTLAAPAFTAGNSRTSRAYMTQSHQMTVRAGCPHPASERLIPRLHRLPSGGGPSARSDPQLRLRCRGRRHPGWASFVDVDLHDEDFSHLGRWLETGRRRGPGRTWPDRRRREPPAAAALGSRRRRRVDERQPPYTAPHIPARRSRASALCGALSWV